MVGGRTSVATMHRDGLASTLRHTMKKRSIFAYVLAAALALLLGASVVGCWYMGWELYLCPDNSVESALLWGFLFAFIGALAGEMPAVIPVTLTLLAILLWFKPAEIRKAILIMLFAGLLACACASGLAYWRPPALQGQHTCTPYTNSAFR